MIYSEIVIFYENDHYISSYLSLYYAKLFNLFRPITLLHCEYLQLFSNIFLN
jgi:hypothetical protein